MTDLKIWECLPQAELLAQLAEEASELSQAALKLRRVIDGQNPTPVSYQTAVRHFNEEIADVHVCLDQLHFIDDEIIHKSYQVKTERWIGRLLEQRRLENERQTIRPDG